MDQQSLFTRDRLPQTVSAGFVILVGSLSLAAWLAQDGELLRNLQSWKCLMKFHTATLFVVGGVALLLLGTARKSFAGVLGGLVALAGLMALAEGLTGWNSRLAEVLYRVPDTLAEFHPVRMSPMAATGFLLAGASLILAASPDDGRGRIVAAGVLGGTVGMAGLVAAYGHLAGIEPAYSWGTHAWLSFTTALAFLGLGIGLIFWTRQNLRHHSTDFVNWLPVAVALMLTFIISLVLAASLADLKAAADARKQSNEVLSGIRALLGGLSEMQRGLRGYMLTGQPEAWSLALSGQKDAREALEQLAFLTPDPAQQERLARIRSDFAQLSAHSEELVNLQASTGLKGVLSLESGGRSFALSNQLAADVNALTEAENKRLREQTALTERRFQDTARLELVACVAVGLLIVLTVGVAQREISRRRRAEERLQKLASMQKAILNSADYAIISVTNDGVVTSFNAAAERMLGRKADEVIGKTTPAAWHVAEEIAARAEEMSRELGHTVPSGFDVFTCRARRGLPEEGEWTLKRQDSSTFPAHLSVTPLESETGEVSGFLGVLSDLTARRKAERDLERSTRRLEAVLHTSIDGVIVFDAIRDPAGRLVDLRYSLLNPAAEILMERSAAGLIGRGLRETHSPMMTDNVFQKFARIIEDDVPLDFEQEVPHGNRSRWFRMAAAKLGDGLLLSYAEITVRKEAEEKLRTFATRLDLATQALQAGVWDWNVRTDEAYWDPTVRRLFGLSPNELVTPEKWLSAILPEDRPLAEGVPKMVKTKEKLSSEYRIRRKDGTIRHIHVAAAPLLDEQGEVVRIIGVNLDVTERKEREEALRLSEERFSNAFEHATTGIALVSPEGRWLKVNEAICALLGYSAEELAARTFQDVTHPDDLNTDLANVSRLLAGEVAFYKMEKRYLHKQGHVVWTQLGVSLLRDKDGRPLYFLSQIEDISHIKQALIHQKDLLQKAQAAERAKSEFLAMMSHEIRTPMNGVLGYAELLASTPMERDQKEYLNTIVTSGEALLRIIDDILDFSRIESGRLAMEFAPFHVIELLKGVKAVLSPRAHQKSVGIELHIENTSSPWFVGDAGRLRQVLINLVGNALKFTESGNVQISLRTEPASEATHLQNLHFQVSDTGNGIPAEKLQEIFRPFTQADSSIARRYGGTGLGLTISQRLVELMGGALQVQSRPGHGSTFSFFLPLEVSPAPHSHEPTRREELNASFATRYPLEILVADDDRVNLGLTTAILKRLGYNPHTVNDGHGVLKAFSRIRPDCILLDMHMPEVDGCEAAERIRRVELSSGARRPCYISALTANVLPTERVACLNAGMNDFLSKPFKLDRLADVLKRAFEAKSGGPLRDLA
jgi:PAS domain S-box-containing protein